MTDAPPIVDAHHHFWDLSLGKHPWLVREPWTHHRYGDYAALRRDYLPRDYLRDADGLNVVRTVYVETEWDPDDPTGEVAWVQDVKAEHGHPAAMVAQAWLDADDVAEVLASHAASGIVRGVRHKPTVTHSPWVPGGMPRGSMSDTRWRDGYALLARHGLSFDLQVLHWHLPEAAQLARDFPETTIIVNHAGLPTDRSAAGLAAWRRSLESIAAQPNAAIKISGIGIPGRPWTVETNREVVLDVIRIFGVERCMFASNFPVDGLAGTFTGIFEDLMAITAQLPEADRRKLFHDNAVRYYRL
jgi:predicted TIM-barrel fold metal-dependent hydrolase